MKPTHNTKSNILGKKNKSYKCLNPNYSGPSLETVISSIHSRHRGIAYLEQYEYLKEVVLDSKIRFVKAFFNALDVQNKQINEDWVTGCKDRHKELSELLSRIIDSDDSLELVVVARTASGIRDFYSHEDLGYCPKKFSIIGIEDDSLIDVFINTKEPKIFSSLFKTMIKVAISCKEIMHEDDGLFSSLSDLALSILEVAGIYNETNPGPKQWKEQEMSTLNILTSSRDTIATPKMHALFQHVLTDIKEGKKPYVKELATAIKATRRYCKSAYNDDDYYFSSKSDPAKIKGFKYTQSILKSIVETDPLRGCEFDSYTGYTSHYNKTAPEGYHAPWVKTTHIPNNGKYKTRAIHSALSPIQDRCCYIHNRLFAVLNKIPSDCTIDQDKGRLFACKISDPDYRELHNWCSIYAFDWSNATDRLDPFFQEECLRLVFGDEIVNFWHTISTCEKEFKFKCGEIHKYIQVNGQPQGLLGSFDAFAFAHHVIMLMTMSLAGLEEEVASNFYRLLGDDSIISSIKYDPTDKAGEAYIEVCEFANLIINRKKSTIVTHKMRIALVDFAKVTVLNGKYFSPIPFRISNRMGSPLKDYYAFSGALWQARHGYFKPSWFMSIIDQYYKDESDNIIAKLAIRSGIVPVFKSAGFDDPQLLNDERCIQFALCYAINKVKATLLSPLLSDKIKENLNILDQEINTDSLEQILPSDLTELWDKIEDPNHKINIAIDNNLEKESIIRELLNCSTDQATIISATLGMTEEEFRVISQSLDIINSLVDAPSTLMLVKENVLNLTKSLSILDRLQYRSIYKRDALDAMLFSRSIKTFNSLFRQGISE